MNGNEKNKDEIPELKMVNEGINKLKAEVESQVEPEVEPEVEIDEADVTMIGNDSEVPLSTAGFPTRSFNAGEVIFNEGDPGNEAYLILNGQVKIIRKHKTKRMVISQLGKDQIFGEMAIITGEPRTATAEAVEPTDVFIITEEKLNENLSQHLAIVKNLIDQLIDRLKQLLKQQSTMVSKVERSIQVDNKLKEIKKQADACEESKSSDQMDEGLKALLKMIREI